MSQVSPEPGLSQQCCESGVPRTGFMRERGEVGAVLCSQVSPEPGLSQQCCAVRCPQNRVYERKGGGGGGGGSAVQSGVPRTRFITAVLCSQVSRPEPGLTNP